MSQRIDPTFNISVKFSNLPFPEDALETINRDLAIAVQHAFICNAPDLIKAECNYNGKNYSHEIKDPPCFRILTELTFKNDQQKSNIFPGEVPESSKQKGDQS